MIENLITIGFDKHGEADFGINCSISDLSLSKLNELRQMIPVAIYIAEDMWRRNNKNKCNQKESESCTLVPKRMLRVNRKENNG